MAVFNVMKFNAFKINKLKIQGYTVVCKYFIGEKLKT